MMPDSNLNDSNLNIHALVREHDIKLAKYETLLERLVDNTEKISTSMVNQEVLLERLANLEHNMQSEIGLLKAEIRQAKEEHKDAKQMYAEKLKPLEILIFLCSYPKISLLLLLGAYAFTIKEFRDLLF